MNISKMNGKNTGISIGIITGVIIVLFLSGKIIDIPFGTHKGGIFSAVGVLVIIAVMIILAAMFHWLFGKKQIQNSVKKSD